MPPDVFRGYRKRPVAQNGLKNIFSKIHEKQEEKENVFVFFVFFQVKVIRNCLKMSQYSCLKH